MLLTAIVLVATSTAYAGWALLDEDGQDAATRPTSTPTPRPTSTPTPTPTSTPTSTPSPSVAASPSMDVPPVDPPDGGSYLEVTLLESGDLDVHQWVRSSTPLAALTLSIPPDPLLGDKVVASHLRVSADGTQADAPTGLGTSPAVITLGAVHRVHLTYRLSGAVLRSPSRADRALARRVSLDIDLNGEPRREPATIRFQGATALTVACDDGSAGAVRARCGQRDATGDWQVRSATGRADRMMVLFELPAASGG